MIKNSYRNEARPATFMFENGMPKKGYYRCPIGPNKLSCHIKFCFISSTSAILEKKLFSPNNWIELIDSIHTVILLFGAGK